MNTQDTVIILSAHLSSLSANENAQRAIAMEQWLQAKGYPFKPVTGVYNGTHELSYVIPAPDLWDEWELGRLARAYGQESILLLDANRGAWLRFIDPTRKDEFLGRFESVPEEVAKTRDSYTFDPSQGVYYVAG